MNADILFDLQSDLVGPRRINGVLTQGDQIADDRRTRRKLTMAYIFHENELPSLISEVPGRERIFFVNQELAKTDDMLAGVMRYKKGAASPYHLHRNCEHFYFIIDGKAEVETEQGVRPVGLGDMVFIPAEEKHRLER